MSTRVRSAYPKVRGLWSAAIENLLHGVDDLGQQIFLGCVELDGDAFGIVAHDDAAHGVGTARLHCHRIADIEGHQRFAERGRELDRGAADRQITQLARQVGVAALDLDGEVGVVARVAALIGAHGANPSTVGRPRIGIRADKQLRHDPDQVVEDERRLN